MKKTRNIPAHLIPLMVAFLMPGQGSGASLTSIDEIPCDHLTIEFNSRQDPSAPFGIPINDWTLVLFDALKSRVSHCGNPDWQSLSRYLEYSFGSGIAQREAEASRTKELLDKLGAIVRDEQISAQRLAAIDEFEGQLHRPVPPEVEREIEQARKYATDDVREAYQKEQQESELAAKDGAPSAEVDKTAQVESDAGGGSQIIPSVSPKFLAKLTAITEGPLQPDQKLADIDKLVRSYGWPSTPPAIAQVVDAAREKILAEQSGNASGPERRGIFLQFSVRYYIAKHCADADAYFTSEEVGRLQQELDRTFSSMSIPQDEKDQIWQNVQATMPAQLAGMTEEECAAEKGDYALIWPQVFAPTDPVANPF